MIKYELKKLFFNRFIAALLIIITVLTAVIAGVTCYNHKVKAVHGDPILYKKGVLTRTFVNQDNVGELLARYDEIINDDSNYDFVDTSKRRGSTPVYGEIRAEVYRKIEALYEPYKNGAVPPDVMEEINRWESYQLSDEVYPEAAALEYILFDFTRTQTEMYPDMYNGTVWESFNSTDRNDTDPAYTEGYNKRTLYRIENGVVYDRNFGWQEIMHTGDYMTPLLIAAVVALASVILFTGEYTNKTDVLIMSSGRGRKRVVFSKITACGIFSTAVTVYYLLLLLLFYGCFFSLDGAASDSRLFINGRMFTWIECFAIMTANLILCNLAIAITALAVSSFCTKTIQSVLISFLFVLVPFILPYAVYFQGNFANILNCLPVNAVLTDFGYSWYDVYTFGDTSVMESHILIAPLATAQLLVSLPFIRAGWKTHKRLN